MIRDSRIWNSVVIGKPVIESIDVDINSVLNVIQRKAGSRGV